MQLVSAKTSVDGKSVECEFDNDRVCVFPYPIPQKVLDGRLSEYANVVKTWIDKGNTPTPIKTSEEVVAEAKAAAYLLDAEKENEKAVFVRAKELAVAKSDTEAVSILDAKIAKYETTEISKG